MFLGAYVLLHLQIKERICQGLSNPKALATNSD